MPVSVALVLLAILVAVAAFAVLVRRIARMNLYQPNSNEAASARLAADLAMEEVSIDGGCSGWFFHNTEGRAPLVLFFGGRGNCASGMISAFEQLGYWDMADGANFMMIDYPGYGKSPGHPSQKSIFAMARAAYDYAVSRADVDPSRIIVEGYSLGTGPATYLASQRDIAGLVLLAPYDNGISLYNSKYDIFHGPMTLFVTQKFDSAAYAEHVTVSPLIITSPSDEMISHTLSESLAAHFPHPADVRLVPGLSHVHYLESSEVRSLIGAYVHAASS